MYSCKGMLIRKFSGIVIIRPTYMVQKLHLQQFDAQH